MSGVVSTSHELNFDAAFGLFHGEICTSFTKEQIEVRLAKEPCGTKYGWQLDEKQAISCTEREGYFHYTCSC